MRVYGCKIALICHYNHIVADLNLNIILLMRPTYKNSFNKNLVLGTASLGGAWGTVDEKESVETILYALQNGITRIDTAPAYANAEKIVGLALKEIPNQNVFVSTKVGKLQGMADEDNLNNYNVDVMQNSLQNSMEVLGKNKIDLLFLHEPEKVPVAQIPEVVGFLKNLKTKGLVSQLGFGGMPTSDFWPYLNQGIFDVAMGFNNLNACSFEGLDSEIPKCRENGLTIYQASVLHMGLLGNRLQAYQDSRPEWVSESDLQNALSVAQIAEKANMRLSTLAHRFALSIQEIDWVVLGARNIQQLKNTLEDISFGPLDETLFNEITSSHYASN